MLCQWFYLWKLVINALFWMYRAWQDATHALMPISLFAGSFYTVFHARTSTTDRLITVTYSPILKKRVSLSLVATSSRHLVYVTVISSYELVHWDNRITLCTILTKNSFFHLRPSVTQTDFAFHSKALYEQHAWKIVENWQLFIEFAMSVFKMMFELYSNIEMAL